MVNTPYLLTKGFWLFFFFFHSKDGTENIVDVSLGFTLSLLEAIAVYGFHSWVYFLVQDVSKAPVITITIQVEERYAWYLGSKMGAQCQRMLFSSLYQFFPFLITKPQFLSPFIAIHNKYYISQLPLQLSVNI